MVLSITFRVKKTYPSLIVTLVLIPQKPMAYYIAKDIRKQKNFAIM